MKTLFIIALAMALLIGTVILAQADTLTVQTEISKTRKLTESSGKWVVGIEAGNVSTLPGKLQLFYRLGRWYHVGLSAYGTYSNPEPDEEDYGNFIMINDTKRYEYRTTLNNIVYFMKTNELLFNVNIRLTGSHFYNFSSYLRDYKDQDYFDYRETIDKRTTYKLELPLGIEYPFTFKGRQLSAGLSLSALAIEGYKRSYENTYSNQDTTYTRTTINKNYAQPTLGTGITSYAQVVLKYWF